MTQKIRVCGLALKPWRFGVVAACGFMFALTAGGAWFPIAKVGGQIVSFVLLIGATLFLYRGVCNGWPAWKHPAAVFSLAVLGGYAGNQLLPLFFG